MNSQSNILCVFCHDHSRNYLCIACVVMNSQRINYTFYGLQQQMCIN